MKAGILTFHNAHNYGAVLQAYALKKTLQEMGVEAEIVNYQNKSIAKNYRKILRPVFWKRDILPTHWKKCMIQIVKCVYGQKTWRKQWTVFEKFIGEKLLDEKNAVILAEQIEDLPYDMYIFGSDQIWCSELTGGLDPVYFGGFKTKARKVTYAASLPGGTIPEREKEYFKEKMKNFDAIAVREERLAKQLEELTGRQIVTTADPTLLLEASAYEPLIAARGRTQKKFVFAYFVVENKVLSECAEYIAQKQGLQLIELHYYRTPWIHGENQFADMGPDEFLWHIKNAEIVLTNSFHGTVFSVIFEKKFYSVYEKNGRISNLLEILELQKRHIYNTDFIDMDESIQYEEVKKRLEQYVEISKQYLLENIK